MVTANASSIFNHAVLVHPRATIERPTNATNDSKLVVKADQFHAWHDRQVDREMGLGKTVNAFVNIRGSSVAREWAEQIVAHHKPVDQLCLPDLIRPKELRSAATAEKPTVISKPASVATPAADSASTDPRARKLICCTCGNKISFPEGKFCWNQAERFGGLQYCRVHQADFT